MQSVPKELVVDTPLSADEVEQALSDALAEDDGVLSLKSRSGRVVVPASKLAYLEIGDDMPPSVGFGSY
jgi:hypothetical protein